MNPFKAIVKGIRAAGRKVDNLISEKRDQEIREMTRAAVCEGLETVGEAVPAVAKLAAGEAVYIKIQLVNNPGE